ncbi:cuticle protein 21-like isoform X2 [Varroa jacobsoni]|uniref:cuticle protein 21-like isoform X2 n=1 Tax=Varroa jacobsoni TaxID=62625 RepID=UPI000BF80DA2|nr:cuticle protein 21-like isoform X2 [Varroa jacobsoni]XP_022700362.1 cuticle protein 21-like isoform X2 [Varroa jacobsoni]
MCGRTHDEFVVVAFLFAAVQAGGVAYEGLVTAPAYGAAHLAAPVAAVPVASHEYVAAAKTFPTPAYDYARAAPVAKAATAVPVYGFAAPAITRSSVANYAPIAKSVTYEQRAYTQTAPVTKGAIAAPAYGYAHAVPSTDKATIAAQTAYTSYAVPALAAPADGYGTPAFPAPLTRTSFAAPVASYSYATHTPAYGYAHGTPVAKATTAARVASYGYAHNAPTYDQVAYTALISKMAVASPAVTAASVDSYGYATKTLAAPAAKAAIAAPAQGHY